MSMLHDKSQIETLHLEGTNVSAVKRKELVQAGISVTGDAPAKIQARPSWTQCTSKKNGNVHTLYSPRRRHPSLDSVDATSSENSAPMRLA